MEKKILVACFSASGVTQKIAEKIGGVLGADIFPILPEEPYTQADLDWTNPKSRSSVEMKDPASRPAIANRVENMDQYQIVLIGFPIWWYVAPTIINTFLESYSFSGKTLIPFATSGSSGLGETEKCLQEVCPGANWLPGRLLKSQAEAEAWAVGLGL